MAQLYHFGNYLSIVFSCPITANNTKNATASVTTSDIGIKYSRPSNPNQIGKIKTSPTPQTSSRSSDKNVEPSALPRACKYMNIPLFTHESETPHKNTLIHLIANFV